MAKKFHKIAQNCLHEAKKFADLSSQIEIEFSNGAQQPQTALSWGSYFQDVESTDILLTYYLITYAIRLYSTIMYTV